MIGWATDVVQVRDKQYTLKFSRLGNYHCIWIGETDLRALAAKLAALGLAAAPAAACAHIFTVPSFGDYCPCCGEKLR